MYSPTKKNTQVRMGLNITNQNKKLGQSIPKRKNVIYGTRVIASYK